MGRRTDFGWTFGSILVCLVIVAGWKAVCETQLVSRAFLPSPERTWAALVAGLASGQLMADLMATVQRMVLGWMLASLVGVAAGAFVGMSKHARSLLGPTLEFLRPLPASALIPVGIAFFGLTQSMVLGIICFGTVWPMLLATMHGFEAVDSRLRDVGMLLHLGRWSVLTKIAIPNALPDILAGMRLGLTIALILSVVGEMLAGQTGLGLRILLAARSYRAPDLYAGVILLGVVGLASNTLLAQIERHVLRWTPAYAARSRS